MSYTYPDYDAADASFGGAAAYTAPDYDAADADWVPPEEITSHASAPSMLGALQPLAVVEVASLSAAGPVLGAMEALAMAYPAALASVASPLGAQAVLAQHDFTTVLGDGATFYVCDLETPGGVVRAPVSSWQATLRTDEAQYAQAVIPGAAEYVETLAEATEFVVYRRVVLPDDTAIEYEMVRCPLEQLNIDGGAYNYTATISGYTDAEFAADDDPPTVYDRTMAGLRTVSSSSGLRRARCAVDWLLRPGQRAYVDGTEMLVDWINYYVGGGDAYMDIGESA